jgi:hypothetical protein
MLIIVLLFIITLLFVLISLYCDDGTSLYLQCASC